jgi:hypothetical protein
VIGDWNPERPQTGVEIPQRGLHAGSLHSCSTHSETDQRALYPTHQLTSSSKLIPTLTESPKLTAFAAVTDKRLSLQQLGPSQILAWGHSGKLAVDGFSARHYPGAPVEPPRVRSQL